jgi:hypothetical protein
MHLPEHGEVQQRQRRRRDQSEYDGIGKKHEIQPSRPGSSIGILRKTDYAKQRQDQAGPHDNQVGSWNHGEPSKPIVSAVLSWSMCLMVHAWERR